jgi:hypothetical protein
MPLEALPSDSPHFRLSDGGPRYTETPAGDPPYGSTLAEPFNAITASFFILIVLIWIVRLRGRYLQYPFLLLCLPILLTGGIGGTIYHATRSSRLWFLMDVVPIQLLGLVISLYLWVRLGPRIIYLIGVIALLALLTALGQWKLPLQWAINLSYASLAIVIVAPIVAVGFRTRFHHFGWIVSGLSFFVIAWISRIVDTIRPPVLPMGTHWLWHSFGAATTYCIAEYLYRVIPLNFSPSQQTPDQSPPTEVLELPQSEIDTPASS